MSQIIEKPWGKEELLEHNDRYMVKRLTMWKGHRCSLQFHNLKTETIFVLSGKLKITTGTSQQDLKDEIFSPGESVTISSKIIHRMEGAEDCVYLEASTPELEDVVRLKDDYSRATV